MTIRKSVLCLAIAAIGPGIARAEATDPSRSMFSISGFGTVGVAHSSYGNADFTGDRATANGAGRTDNWSIAPMTRLGVQVDAQLSPQWSASVQAISEYNYDNNYDPKIVSAFVKYQPIPELDLRAGRLVSPVYMLSDYAQVGYAMPWARPPFELYTRFVSQDGVDAIYKFLAGGATFSTQASYSSATYKTNIGNGAMPSYKFDDALSLTLTADVGASTFRISHMESKVTTNSDQINAVLNGYHSMGDALVAGGNPSLAAVYYTLADSYQPTKRRVEYNAIGYSYDPGQWFLRAEIAQSRWKQKVLLNAQTMAYVSAGYRHGAFTPYVIFGRDKMDSPTSIGAADPGIPGQGQLINALLAAADTSRRSVSLGMRWDFRNNMDFKLQYTHFTRALATSQAGLTNLPVGTAAPSSFNALFAGIDFLF